MAEETICVDIQEQEFTVELKPEDIPGASVNDNDIGKFAHAPRGNQLRLTGSACINKVILLLLLLPGVADLKPSIVIIDSPLASTKVIIRLVLALLKRMTTS